MTVIERRFMDTVLCLLGRIRNELEKANMLKELELKSRNVLPVDACPTSLTFLAPADGGDA